jgi:hypothetical protein
LAGASVVAADGQAGAIDDNAAGFGSFDIGCIADDIAAEGVSLALRAAATGGGSDSNAPLVTEGPTICDAAMVMLSRAEDGWILSGVVTTDPTKASVFDDVTAASAAVAIDENGANQAPAADDDLLVAVPAVVGSGFLGGLWALAFRRRRHSHRARRARRSLYRERSW